MRMATSIIRSHTKDPGMTRYYVAGHTGMVGRAILRNLEARGSQVITRTHAELDLTDQSAVRTFMQAERPDAVRLSGRKLDQPRAVSFERD